MSRIIYSTVLSVMAALICCFCNSKDGDRVSPEQKQAGRLATRAQGLLEKNPEGALILCDSAMSLISGSKIMDTFGLVICYVRTDALSAMGLSDSAYTVIKDMYEKQDVWPDTTSRIWALYKLAWYSYLASRVQVSEAYMSRAIELLEATNTRKNRANLMIFYADILSDRGKYTDAQEYLFKAVRISESEKDTFALALGYMSIGHVYGFCGNLVNSLAYYKKANDLFNQLGEHEYEIAVLTDIGLTYRELDKPDSALYYYHHALTIDSATINVRNKVITLFNIGNVYLDVEDISKARKYYNDVWAICENNNIKSGFPKVYGGFAALEIKEGNFAKAEKYYQEAIKLATEMGDNSSVIELMKAYRYVYVRSGEWKKLNQVSEKIGVMEDSLLGIENRMQLQDIEQKYEIEKHELQNGYLNASLDRENRNSHLLFSLLVVSLIALMVTTFMIVKNKRLKQGLNTSYNILMEQYRGEKKGLVDTLSSGTSNGFTDEISGRLMDYFKQDKPYLNHALKVSDVTDLLGISRQELQTSLRVLGFQNFNALLNHFRVQEALTKLEDPQYNHYTIEAIAKEAGFGTRSSFYMVFESLKGVKPSFYRSQINLKKE